MKQKLTQERLKELLDYDPETGLFIWKVDRGNNKIKGKIAGCLDKESGYWKIAIDKKNYRAHRLAFLYIEGYLPENQVDHKDRDRANNKWDNLREASQTCNMRNQKININNKSGVTGVCWDNSRKKWRAYIEVPQKINIGRFDNLIDAVKARWKAELQHNFPNCNTISSAYVYLKEHGGL